jgi:hypothetical protein
LKHPGRVFSLWWAALLVLSFSALVYPMFVIQPFRRQYPTELQVALFVLRWRPYLEAAASIAVVAALVRYWRSRPRIIFRILATVGALLVCGFAWLSRINIYERMMFHHYDHPSFSAAAQAKLDGDEKVIAISIGGVARAYPIRSMSYHHVVNDVVGGVPIVATY